LQSDDDFSTGVLFGQVADGFGDLVQAATLVDNWGYFSGGQEFAQEGQVLFIQFRDKTDELLAYESRPYQRGDQTGQETELPATA
jgi:hypothetical protein